MKLGFLIAAAVTLVIAMMLPLLSPEGGGLNPAKIVLLLVAAGLLITTGLLYLFP